MPASYAKPPPRKEKPTEEVQNGLRPVLYDSAGEPVRAWVSELLQYSTGGIGVINTTGVVEIEPNLYSNFRIEYRDNETFSSDEATWTVFPGNDYFNAVYDSVDCSGPAYAALVPGNHYFHAGLARFTPDPIIGIISPVVVPSRDLVVPTEGQRIIDPQYASVFSAAYGCNKAKDLLSPWHSDPLMVHETRVVASAQSLAGPYRIKFE